MTQVVSGGPVFEDLAARDAEPVHMCRREASSGRRVAHELTLVGAACHTPHRYHLTLGDHALDLETGVREGRQPLADVPETLDAALMPG